MDSLSALSSSYLIALKPTSQPSALKFTIKTIKSIFFKPDSDQSLPLNSSRAYSQF
jgi:hypothetical protein